MPTSTVCVDASLALRLVLPEAGQEQVLATWSGWVESGVRLVSPYLFAYETTSVVRNRTAHGLLSAELAEAALAELLAQEVELLHPADLEPEAFALARDLARPTAYNALYLALDKLLACETWTADARLYDAVHERPLWVSLVPGA